MIHKCHHENSWPMSFPYIPSLLLSYLALLHIYRGVVLISISLGCLETMEAVWKQRQQFQSAFLNLPLAESSHSLCWEVTSLERRNLQWKTESLWNPLAVGPVLGGVFSSCCWQWASVPTPVKAFFFPQEFFYRALLLPWAGWVGFVLSSSKMAADCNELRIAESN